jgi:cytochrome c5
MDSGPSRRNKSGTRSVLWSAGRDSTPTIRTVWAPERRATGDPMSKQDAHFSNTFTAVIVMLAVVAVGIFILSRVVARHRKNQHKLSETNYGDKVRGRIGSPGQVAIAGQDTAAMAIQAHAGGPASSAELSTTQANGAELLEAKCNVCHGPGIAGAPKIGDKAAWAPRIVQGKATLYEHAIQGFEGSSGVMPPRGGPTGAPDALIQQAVDQMIQFSR